MRISRLFHQVVTHDCNFLGISTHASIPVLWCNFWSLINVKNTKIYPYAKISMSTVRLEWVYSKMFQYLTDTGQLRECLKSVLYEHQKLCTEAACSSLSIITLTSFHTLQTQGSFVSVWSPCCMNTRSYVRRPRVRRCPSRDSSRGSPYWSDSSLPWWDRHL